jgi:ATP-dependent DNA ligase
MVSPCSMRATAGGTVSEAMLYGFDLLELNGQDLRPLSLGERKKRLARLLARVTPGVASSRVRDTSTIAGSAAYR